MIYYLTDFGESKKLATSIAQEEKTLSIFIYFSIN